MSKNKISSKFIEVDEPNKKFKIVYSTWYKKFRKCADVYPKMQDLYDRLERWIQESGIKITLAPGTTPEKLDASVQKIRQSFTDPTFEWPLDMYCWYLMTNGQQKHKKESFLQPGLFGGFTFYDYRTDMRTIPIEDLMDNFLQRRFTTVLPGVVPIAVSAGGKMHFLVIDPKCSELGSFSRYQLVTSGGQKPTPELGFYYFPLAESFSALLKHHVTNLENGTIGIRDGRISLFPLKNIPSATTRNVTITASPLFIPERSTPDKEYLWAYSITLSMDQQVPNSIYDCQLTSRHWDITSADGQNKTVDGPGVIGEYPKMFPGAKFIYESCCPLGVSSGTMGGSFQMKRNYDKVIFNAIVPTFTFVVPEIIREDDQDEKIDMSM